MVDESGQIVVQYVAEEDVDEKAEDPPVDNLVERVDPMVQPAYPDGHHQHDRKKQGHVFQNSARAIRATHQLPHRQIHGHGGHTVARWASILIPAFDRRLQICHEKGPRFIIVALQDAEYPQRRVNSDRGDERITRIHGLVYEPDEEHIRIFVGELTDTRKNGGHGVGALRLDVLQLGNRPSEHGFAGGKVV